MFEPDANQNNFVLLPLLFACKVEVDFCAVGISTKLFTANGGIVLCTANGGSDRHSANETEGSLLCVRSSDLLLTSKRDGGTPSLCLSLVQNRVPPGTGKLGK